MSASTSRASRCGGGYKWEPFTSFGCGRTGVNSAAHISPLLISAADFVIADYLAIGPCVPCRMVKKGAYKYIFTHGHPDLLFNLGAEPDECFNLAEDASSAPILAALKKIGMDGYDPDILMTKIVASQRRRSFIAKVPGKKPDWDYVAFQEDAERYVRRDGVDVTKSRLRLPHAATIPPDLPELTSTMTDCMMRGEIDFQK